MAIGRIGGVKFVATPDPSKAFARGNSVVDREGEIAGDAEDISYAYVMQAGENVLCW